MADIEKLDRQFNEFVKTGQAMDAFEKFTSDDVVMIEPGQEPVSGKDANRQREQDFYGIVEEFHGIALRDAAVSGNASFSEWEVDITFKDGNRANWTQVERRKWSDDGKVQEVRFFYDPSFS